MKENEKAIIILRSTQHEINEAIVKLGGDPVVVPESQQERFTTIRLELEGIQRLLKAGSARSAISSLDDAIRLCD